MTQIFKEYYDLQESRQCNEAWGAVSKVLLNIALTAIEQVLGTKLISLFGENFRRSDGSSGTGFRIMNSSGDMIRLNTEDKNPNRSVIVKAADTTLNLINDWLLFGLARPFCSIDYWKSSNKNIYKPTYTCFITHIGDTTVFIRNPQLFVGMIRFLCNGKTGEFHLSDDGDDTFEVSKGKLEENSVFSKIEELADRAAAARNNSKWSGEFLTNKNFLDDIWEQLDLEGYSSKAIKYTAQFMSKHPTLLKAAESTQEAVEKIAIVCHLKESNPKLKDNEIGFAAENLF